MSSLHSYRYVVEFQFDLFWYLTSIIQIVLQMFYITHFAIKKTFPLFCRFICFALSWNWIPSDTTLHHFIRVLFFHLIISILKFAVNFFHRICSFFSFAIHCVWVCVCVWPNSTNSWFQYYISFRFSHPLPLSFFASPDITSAALSLSTSEHSGVLFSYARHIPHFPHILMLSLFPLQCNSISTQPTVLHIALGIIKLL